MKEKRGQETSTLIPWIIAVAILGLVIAGTIIINRSGSSAIDVIKSMLGRGS
ncbi:MAG: hypothetical protein AABW73_04075 [Nanoarchaeota archaeon]